MTIDRKFLVVSFIALIFIFFAHTSIAQPQAKEGRPSAQNSDWSISLGAIGMYRAEYEGSDDYEFMALPAIDIAWRDTLFLNARDGLGAYLFNQDGLKLGVALGYAFGRDEDDSSYLEGLGDIDGGATANAFIKWKVNRFAFNASFEQQISGESTGFQSDLSLGYALPLGRKLLLLPSLKTTYASSDYMDEYFAISTSQATQSGLATYNADSGFKSAAMSLISIYRLDQHWSVNTMVSYKRLLGDAADSPIVKDENQYLLGVGLSYKF